MTVESDEPVGGDTGACRVVSRDPETVRAGWTQAGQAVHLVRTYVVSG